MAWWAWASAAGKPAPPELTPSPPSHPEAGSFWPALFFCLPYFMVSGDSGLSPTSTGRAAGGERTYPLYQFAVIKVRKAHGL